jgi:hypothetical protein
MRRGDKPQLVVEGDKVIGVSLGADYCAEHEWGIASLQRVFGINTDESVFGINRRIITDIPKGFDYYTLGKLWGFYYLPYGSLAPYVVPVNGELSSRSFKKEEKPDTNIRCAWDEHSFAVVSDLKDDKKYLKTIFEEFQKKNGLITLAGGRVFQNAGLCLIIADRLSKSITDLWYDADKTRHEVAEEVKATGIEELLKEKGKRYFALSPRRQEDGTIKYWLNPYDQQDNNYGWYTLDDLKKWAEGYGPIPLKPMKIQ